MNHSGPPDSQTQALPGSYTSEVMVTWKETISVYGNKEAGVNTRRRGQGPGFRITTASHIPVRVICGATFDLPPCVVSDVMHATSNPNILTNHIQALRSAHSANPNKSVAPGTFIQNWFHSHYLKLHLLLQVTLASISSTRYPFYALQHEQWAELTTICTV